MQVASQHDHHGKGKELFDAMEQELARTLFALKLAEAKSNGQDFGRHFYAAHSGAKLHWGDPPHIEKCTVHGLQRQRAAVAEQIQATVLSELSVWRWDRLVVLDRPRVSDFANNPDKLNVGNTIHGLRCRADPCALAWGVAADARAAAQVPPKERRPAAVVLPHHRSVLDHRF